MPAVLAGQPIITQVRCCVLIPSPTRPLNTLIQHAVSESTNCRKAACDLLEKSHEFRTITVATLLHCCSQEIVPVIVEYTRYKIDEPRRDAFEKVYTQATGSLAGSSHCLAYELSRCTESPEHYVLRIEWDSEEGHLKGFRSTPQFKAFFSLVQPFFKDIEEMRHYAVLSTDRKQIEPESLRNR